jgi:predicted acylesterase/phospholipase RssA
VYCTKMIEHLVLSGAGTNGLVQIGLLHYLIDQEKLALTDIKSIYATSAGAILSILILIGVPIPEMKEYIIHRPWEKFFDVQFHDKGIFPSSHLSDMVKPFMLAYDIPDTYTLLELYQKSGVDLHIFTTKINGMECVDLNHTTFPTLTLSETIQMTASLPIVFTPVKYNNEYYIDGGFMNNCPLQSIQKHPYHPDSILIIDIAQQCPIYTEESDMFNYMHILFLNALDIICANTYNKTCKHDYKHYYLIDVESMFKSEVWIQFINNIEYRQQLYDYGYHYLNNTETKN